MLWLQYAFFGLMLVLGAAAFVLYRRGKEPRAWIWLIVALIGAAGLAGVLAGHADGLWRTLAMAAMFELFAVDHLVQYLQSRRKGAPTQFHLFIGLAWLVFGVIQLLNLA